LGDVQATTPTTAQQVSAPQATGSGSSRNSSTGSSTAAQSPTLTDGALTLPSSRLELPSLPSVGSSVQPNTQSLIETNLPSYQAMLVGTSADTTASQSSLIPTDDAWTTSPVAPTTHSAAATGVPATDTPELSTEAIIRAWQMHKAVNQAQASPSNRYVNPNAVNSGGTTSFTLGATGTAVHSASPAPNTTSPTPPVNPTLPRF